MKMKYSFRNKLAHFYNRKKCLHNAEWGSNELRCKLCGEQLAFRYINPDDARIVVHIFIPYKKFRSQIERGVY